ncbi:hypothetical protein I302_102244 [Kwoniella bestiolae CBS 10118]|uniref:Glycosyltransferase family 8 protein n=1 Tax=Kwoniella bestiolae CBS 10118 TaxID=1296100 RepID=A0A1B9GEI9_9TREE|nr:hypothetical protein I302_00933 [Kwoniella bestiolae CBS 10118]OCF29428.1 hypothetical protein I302_00933 [Kwoniella bestiolae CBS 10118]
MYKLPSPVQAPTNKKPNKRRFRYLIFQILGAILLLSWISYSFSSGVDRISLKIHPAVEGLISRPGPISPIRQKEKKKEAYVTFLSSITDPAYLLSTRLLIYQLLHDPLNLDSTRSRDIVVVLTPEISQDVEALLMREGATIERVELLDGLDLPEQVNDHWRDQYTKLNIFNLTSYERVLYLDNDVLLLKSLEDIWHSDGSDLPSGLGGVGENSKRLMRNTDLRIPPPEGLDVEEKDYLNAGFMLIRPDEGLFEELRGVRGYDTFYMEQALINHYFDWEGEHPWTALDYKFVSHFPRSSDIEEGYHSLHAKMWKDPVPQAVRQIWEQAVERMEEHWRWHEEE